jgi:hypothetical protein
MSAAVVDFADAMELDSLGAAPKEKAKKTIKKKKRKTR